MSVSVYVLTTGVDNLKIPGDSTAANFESILIYRQFMGLL